MKNIKLPNEKELEVLKNISIKDSRDKVRLRAKIILSAESCVSCRKIASLLNCDKNTVFKWIDYWNEGGLGAILTWRDVKYNEKFIKRRDAVEKLITSDPTSLKLPFSTWSLKKLSAFFADLVDISISPSTLWRDLKTINLTFKTTKDTFIDKPIDYDIKKAWLKFLERYLPPNWRMVFVDEKGPVHALRYSGRLWSFKQPLRSVRQKSKGNTLFLGGYDKNDRFLSMVPMEYKDSGSFCQALDWIRMEFLQKECNHLLLVMDNAPIHKSAFTLNYLEQDPQIDYFFLPAYSPELNPIEGVFKLYQEEFLNNASYNSKEELIEQTSNYADYFNTLRREIYA